MGKVNKTAHPIKFFKYLYLTNLHCISEAISLSIAKNKQSAESKQMADFKNFKFSFPTTLYFISEAIFQSIAKGKQSAESKQTADVIKNLNSSNLTT